MSGPVNANIPAMFTCVMLAALTAVTMQAAKSAQRAGKQKTARIILAGGGTVWASVATTGAYVTVTSPWWGCASDLNNRFLTGSLMVVWLSFSLAVGLLLARAATRARTR
ncbi:MAG TPA: hypothetical protein VFO38_02665 [Candidatus Saccharimonadales bacterium]|nr:hypothetical protein [Candidatus Saccharimonadales bacterium]